jgi:hypothetical protein
MPTDFNEMAFIAKCQQMPDSTGKVTVEELHRRAQEAADYAERGLVWPPLVSTG